MTESNRAAAKRPSGKFQTLHKEPKFNPPEIFTATTLLGEEIPPIRWVVEGVLPEGLTILAGKPKKGKSWLSLELCVGVVTGRVAYGRFRAKRGEALYIGLEDSRRRLQDRLRQLVADDELLTGLHLATDWPRFDAGGLDALDAWLTEHPACLIVTLDTYVKVRPARKSRDVYAEDYRISGMLKALADRHHVAIVAVLHLRKEPTDDPIDAVHGSVGISGAADTLWIIVPAKPKEQVDGFLYINGRDIVDGPQEFALQRPVTGGPLKADPAGTMFLSWQRLEVLRVLKEANRPMTPTEVAQALDKNYNSVKKLMWEMGIAGQLKSAGDGAYVPNITFH